MHFIPHRTQNINWCLPNILDVTSTILNTYITPLDIVIKKCNSFGQGEFRWLFQHSHSVDCFRTMDFSPPPKKKRSQETLHPELWVNNPIQMILSSKYSNGVILNGPSCQQGFITTKPDHQALSCK
jgi:hypothetical protein